MLQYCGVAIIETKNRAMAITEKLEQQLDIPKKVRIHWTGCPNSCGQVSNPTASLFLDPVSTATQIYVFGFHCGIVRRVATPIAVARLGFSMACAWTPAPCCCSCDTIQCMVGLFQGPERSLATFTWCPLGAFLPTACKHWKQH